MRVKVVITKDSEDSRTEQYEHVYKVWDSLHDVLILQNREELIIKYTDRTVTYGPIEYECMFCGEYGHSSEEDCETENL